MRVEPAMRQPGLVHDRVHPDGVDPVAAEQRAGRGEDPLARLRLAFARHPHASHPCIA